MQQGGWNDFEALDDVFGPETNSFDQKLWHCSAEIVQKYACVRNISSVIQMLKTNRKLHRKDSSPFYDKIWNENGSV